MGIVAWIVLGAIAEFVANLIVGGREGLIGTVVLGIVGAVVGGFVATQVLNVGSVDGLNLQSVVIAIAGSIGVLLVWHLLMSRNTGRASI